MTYIVSLAMMSGPSLTLTVQASNKSDAEYTASMKAGTVHGRSVSHVLKCFKTGPYRA